jgi:hypothetical protein
MKFYQNSSSSVKDETCNWTDGNIVICRYSFLSVYAKCIKLFTYIQKYRSAYFPCIIYAILFTLSYNYHHFDFMCLYHSVQYILLRITGFLDFIHIPYLNRLLDVYILSVTSLWQETDSV